MKVSGFSKTQPFTPAFNGNKELPEVEQFRVKLIPIKLHQLLDVQDTLAQAQPAEGDKPSSDQLRSIVKLHGPLLRDHIVIEQGADGFSIDDIAEYAHFFDLALELLKQLNKISQPTERDVKN